MIWAESQRINPDKTQRAGGWSWVNRMASEWESAMVNRVEDMDCAWDVPIKGLQGNGLSVVSLRTPRELVRQALLMRNCLDEKINECRSGVSLFYAIWRSGNQQRPLAHVGLRLVGGIQPWRIMDCKGFANAPASTLAWQVADELERRCNVTRRTVASASLSAVA